MSLPTGVRPSFEGTDPDRLAELVAALRQHRAECPTCGGSGDPAACPEGTALRHTIAAMVRTEAES